MSKEDLLFQQVITITHMLQIMIWEAMDRDILIWTIRLKELETIMTILTVQITTWEDMDKDTLTLTIRCQDLEIITITHMIQTMIWADTVKAIHIKITHSNK
jgi:hypothetical protein